jgi:hypothetical protein
LNGDAGSQNEGGALAVRSTPVRPVVDGGAGLSSGETEPDW